MPHIVIIGNGISGITAARHIRKMNNDTITVISGESDYFFSRTALMYIYMGHMKYTHTKPYEDNFWKKNKINLRKAWVKTVDVSTKTLLLENQEKIQYDTLIIATGSKPNKFGWKGQELEGVQGLYSLQDLELMEKTTQNISGAVIVGGGLIGIEMTEMLLSRNIPVTFLVRDQTYWSSILSKEEGQLIGRHIRAHHIDLRLNTELDEILGKNGKVAGVRTNTGEEIPCEFVGLAVGVSPNIDFLKDTEIEIKKGVLVNEYLETNIPDVYAIGDCAQRRIPLPDRKAIEPIWYTGRIMGETVAKTICGSKTTYQPGVWFNSAKFLDIEYQTYGWVWNNPKEGEKTFYWEAKDGTKCVRINYREDTHAVLGVNVFGIRFRHEVWDKWIREEKKIEEVLEHLPQANFDPEFFKQYEGEIIARYNTETKSNLKIKARKGLLARWF